MCEQSPFQSAKRVVIKVGTSTLTHDSGLINLRRIETLVKVLSDLANSGKELILVSSGSIGVGVGKLRLPGRPKDMPTKQAAAAVGQCELMHIYENLFSQYNHTVAQILLTRDVIENPERKRNVRNTFERLLDMSVIPVVNNNDTVSVDEIDFSDNDNLSAIVAGLVGADAVVLMTDIDGLYTANPRTNPEARLISRVETLSDDIREMAAGVGSSRGTGGMTTKLEAAAIVMPQGIHMAIVTGQNPKVLYRLFDGEVVGTHFVGFGKEARGECTI